MTLGVDPYPIRVAYSNSYYIWLSEALVLIYGCARSVTPKQQHLMVEFVKGAIDPNTVG